MTTWQLVRDLLPEVAKHADEVERGRGLPDPLYDGLREAGCLRMLAPVAHGGSGLSVPDTLRVVETLATADGSVAWLVGQVALSQLIIGCAAEETVATVFADGPDVYAAGSVAPKGRATGVEGGWRVSGQWPFVTGCERAEWVYLNCVLVRGRSVALADGRPATRIMVLPAADVTVVDTWHTLGLRGTGSHDLAVSGGFCPDGRAVTLTPGTAGAQRAAMSIAQSSLIIAAAASGIAQAALRDVVELATGGKRPALSATRLAASTTFQERLGEARMVAQAGRALLYDQAGQEWGADAGPDAALRRAQVRAAAAQATALAVRATDTAFELAGGTAVYDSSPLSRRLRDANTARQHFVASRHSYTAFGAHLVGEGGDGGPL
ncbi:acyl-CoA dehydrogenase family protein [Micromonospora sp. WMMD987]|uniref:acyl-CoA dehydrogenase family protein n=1 Tax=Micromonospora sp. WMMD987 TaxID=3016089 RepID=UPI00249B4B4B|nr:acyl-CoA dehydrogenase family protein [Micromonospora sp. WMMD987]WFE97445.1 acyl-CoA dehydrogenase family protein [Micromonospora sp. WMMD987]